MPHTREAGGNVEQPHDERSGRASERPEVQTKEWAKIAHALGDLWDVTEKIADDKLSGYKGAEYLMQQLRIHSQASFDAIREQFELAGKNLSEINHLFQELIEVAQDHRRDHFVNLLTDAKVSHGKAKKIFHTFNEGFSSQNTLEHREEPENLDQAA